MRRERQRTPTVDMMDVFERTCIDMAKPYSRRGRWSRDEADATVAMLCAEFAPACQTLYDLVEDERDDEVYSLAAQERTRRDLMLCGRRT